MPSDKPFFLRHHQQFTALQRWLNGRRYNAWRTGMKDRKGNPMIGLKHDEKPDSDWGKNITNRGLVIVIGDHLYQQALDLVEQQADT